MIKESILKYSSGLKAAIDGLSMDKLEQVIDLMLKAYNAEKQIFVFGNGGSGATASHFACDINKGVSFGLEKRFKIICLNDNIATMLAYANDSSYDDIFVEQLKNFLQSGDLVIGISGSGNSLNVIKAVEYANEKRAVTVVFTGFNGGRLSAIVKTALIVPVNDMQQIEDAHLILTHVIMRVLYAKLRE